VRYFAYKGDRLETGLFGLSFQAGRPTAVDPATVSPKHIAKLVGNPEFAEVFEGYTVTGDTVDVKATEIVPPVAALLSPDDRSDSDEIEALRQEADTLGVKIDMRWGLVRLRREVEAARG
jgi:hypothetical protein